ncbi:LysM peptidoglycan-binding domain-containing protein [Herbaspirillum seropedicae]|uniref:LysM peptidoglycan-binding domain-containing protein n=1 Tax=Herbaspirillum seropedicae TaxID=964 RepID=UPI0011232FA9|nr:LysM domain-containing protein [Herbaspirillum seropedicae]QDD65538.1 LysM peptidoglycan-binding domain-containing protein [Herbaspirillum seropedicae]
MNVLRLIVLAGLLLLSGQSIADGMCESECMDYWQKSGSQATDIDRYCRTSPEGQIESYKKWIAEGHDMSNILADIKAKKTWMTFFGGNRVTWEYAACVMQAAGAHLDVPSSGQAKQTPKQTPPMTGAVSSFTRTDYYIVGAEEKTLEDVSRKTGISVANIIAWNGFKSDRDIFEGRAVRVTDKPAAPPKGSMANNTNNQSNDTSDLVYFPPVTAQCIKKGKDPQGRPTYTNVCNTTIQAGWCYLEQTTGTLGLCEAKDSTFSRTGKNYVTQDGGWAPGTSYTVSMSKNGTQFTFLVACKNGFPLIESFDGPTITRSSKARMVCWRFKSGKK